MELSQLRYFLKVVEHENFTRAAEDCGISQPALSQAVIKLEEELGQPVFERLRRRIALTDAGRVLLSRAEQIVSLVENTATEITDDGRTGRLRVAAIPTVAPYLLPELLRSFSERFPQARLDVYEEVTASALKRCSHGEIDVALLALPIEVKYLQVEPLFEEELLLVLAANHPLLKKKRITIRDVRQQPFVLLNETHCLADHVLSFCRHRAFHPVMVERLSQLATVLELVSLGLGVSLIPQMARQADHSQQRAYRSLAGEKPTRQVAMCWNPYRFQSRLQKSFLAHVRASVAG